MSRKQRYPFEASARGLVQQADLLYASKKIGMCPWTEFKFHAQRRWRFDCAFPTLKIGIEYHGGLFMSRRGGHQSVKGARNDWAKLNEAQILGWLVLQFGPDETRTGEAMNTIERAIQVRITMLEG